MTRTLLSAAAALFAATALVAPAAQACISCEYVPEVVNTPVYSHGGGGYYAKKRIITTAAKKRAPAKKQIVETKAAPKKVETAKADPIEADPVDVAPAKTEAESENSTISTASVEPSKSVEPTSETKTEDKTEAKKAAGEEPKVSANVGCKKFFPTVGMTLSVPCE
jgi:hypothetical protein